MWLFTHQLLDGLVLAGVYALIAVSLTFIYAVSKQLQLAHGEVMILGAYAGYFTLLVVPNLFVALAVGLVLERSRVGRSTTASFAGCAARAT